MFFTSKIHAHMCSEQMLLVLLVLSCAGPYTKAEQTINECDSKTVFQRVNLLLEGKQYDQASKLLDQFRNCPIHSPVETFQIGWLYGRARRFDIALKIFDSVPQNIPDPLTHDYAIALSKFELANYQGAIDVLKPYQSSGTADEKAVNLLGVSYSKLGLYREAYATLEEETHRESSDVITYLNLVTVCAEAGNFAKAADIAGQARHLFPNSADVLIVQGAANTLLGHLDQAYEDFAAATRLAPTRADARFFLGLIDYKQGKFPDAISTLQGALKDGIADADLHYLIAECLLKLHSANTDQALHELDRALELNTDLLSARTLRGKLLLEAGHPEKALADLEFANHRDRDSRAALYNLARAYRALGRVSDAQALFRQLRTETADTLNEFSNTRLNEALTRDPKQK
jgi:tetratricopeptide (TPR) repeat protein